MKKFYKKQHEVSFVLAKNEAQPLLEKETFEASYLY